MNNKFKKFLSVYMIFILWAVCVNGIIIETIGRVVLKIPEPWDPGLFIFYFIFNSIGTIIFFIGKYNSKIMGIFSLIIGQILEFTFMRPEWVKKFYALEIGGETIAPLIVSSILAWFPVWFFPSYIAHKYIFKREEKYSDKFAKRLLFLMIALFILIGVLSHLK